MIRIFTLRRADSRSRNKLKMITKSLLAVFVLATALEIIPILRALGLDLSLSSFRYQHAVLANGICVLAVAAAAGLLARGRGDSLRASLGLRWSGFKAPSLVLLSTLPCWIVLGLQAGTTQPIDALDMLMLALLFPLAEEVTFRGYGFVFFRKALGWRLIPAVMVQAVVFGGVHWLGAGHNAEVAIQIFAITFLGGVLFACLDALNSYSIWAGWVFHVSLNAAWNVFPVSDSAAAGWLGNVLRLVSGALAILLLYLFIYKPSSAIKQTQALRAH